MRNVFASFIESPGPTSRHPKNRFAFFAVSVGCIVTLFVVRSFYLQVIEGSVFRARAEQNRVEREVVPAPRGILYDRNQIQLVENVSSTDLVFDPALLPSQENEGYLIDNLAALLPFIQPRTIQDALVQARSTQRPTIIAKALNHEDILALEEGREHIHGVELVSTLVRKYPRTYSASHVIGYTSAVTAQELESDPNLSIVDTTGKQGIEKMYDEALRGIHGYAYKEVNASGLAQADVGRQEPIKGKDLQLTIDIELQEFIYGLFSQREQEVEKGSPDTGSSGAVIVLDPRSGEIRAMVSYPSQTELPLYHPLRLVPGVRSQQHWVHGTARNW